MSQKTRIHKLASELGVATKDLIQQCEDMGLPGVTNHMSTIPSEAANYIRQHYGIRPKPELPRELFPKDYLDAIFIPRQAQTLFELARIAKPEPWEYNDHRNKYPMPVLFNYLKNTYQQSVIEGKIAVSENLDAICFNTGLLTPAHRWIYFLATRNYIQNRSRNIPWHFQGWYLYGAHELARFMEMPDVPDYCEDTRQFVYDKRSALQFDLDHIVQDNRNRFPAQYQHQNEYRLNGDVQAAIANAEIWVQHDRSVAIPQYFNGKIQLLLPLCLQHPEQPDLALAVSFQQHSYRASTCLTLDMAYNNARQLGPLQGTWLERKAPVFGRVGYHNHHR